MFDFELAISLTKRAMSRAIVKETESVQEFENVKFLADASLISLDQELYSFYNLTDHVAVRCLDEFQKNVNKLKATHPYFEIVEKPLRSTLWT
jgi:hypothetical protein